MKKVTPVSHPEKMKSYWKKEWKVLTAVAATGFLFDGSMSLGPILLGNLIDAVAGNRGSAEITRQAFIYFGIIALIQILRTVKRYTVRVFANRTSASMRLMIYNSILHADSRTIGAENTGDLLNKAVADVDIATEGMRKVTTEFFDTGVLMAGYLITLLSYNVTLTLASCAFIPVSILIAQGLKKAVTKQNRAARAQSSKVAEQTYETAGHMLLYRINGLAFSQDEAYDRELAILEKESVRADVLETSMQPVYNAIAMFGAVFIFVMGAPKVTVGIWTIGQFSAYLSIFIAFAVKASKAAKLFNSYQKAKVSWNRIRGYFREYVSYETSQAAPIDVQTLDVSHLSFSWPKTESGSIHEFNLKAHAGEIIGLTGPVACGKSSLAAALTGMEGYQGSILINGRELHDFNPQSSDYPVEYMGHDPMLLSDTIENNIRLGKDGDIAPVLKDAAFEEDLKGMQEGVQTQTGNAGVRLSGGQQERISLARILFHKSGILILDDPFASVDPVTEKKIYDRLRERYQDRIILIISHRLNLFPQMDQVILMEDGSHFTAGTHEELMQNAEYRNLFELQEVHHE